MKLGKMNVPVFTVLWILDYLTNRPQYVRLCSDVMSDFIHTNTGGPQGTCLSPFLFSLYTADCRTNDDDCQLDKYADDTALTGLITGDDDAHYKQELDRFVEWGDENYLLLNVDKTKEMIIDFRRMKTAPPPMTSKGKEVERVQRYKYLGVTIDNTLSWKDNTDALIKKTNTRMYCLRKLRSFNVDSCLLQMFYTATISSILTFASVCWGGNICRQDKDRLEKTIKKAGGVVGRRQKSFEDMHEDRVAKKVASITKDDSHPLCHEFDSRVIERSGRLRAPKTRTTRYSNSFVPTAVRSINRKGRTLNCERERERERAGFVQ